MRAAAGLAKSGVAFEQRTLKNMPWIVIDPRPSLLGA
jgi:hypothetical protein